MAEPIYHWNIAQGTDEWKALKAGKWSSSKAAVIMGGLDTSGLASLIEDLAWERVHGPIGGGFKSAAMERGSEMEPESRDCYAFDRDVIVRECGFVEHAEIPNVGWSPDGLIGPAHRRAVEAKNPGHRAWMKVKKTGLIPSEYRWQCKWGMWVGQLDGLDFISYRPEAGLIVIAAEVSESEKQQMAERVALLEPKVQAWVELITDGSKAA